MVQQPTAIPAPGSHTPSHAPAAAPQPSFDTRRDPFAAASTRMAAQPILDAGPLIDIPETKKNPLKVVLPIVICAVVFLAVGMASGKIFHARQIYNATSDDAKRIHDQLETITKLNDRVLQELQASKERIQKRQPATDIYDEDLINALNAIRTESPIGNPESAENEQNKFFKANYGMMPDKVVHDLSRYFYDSVRVMEEIKLFVQNARGAKEDIQKHGRETAPAAGRKYGLVFAEDQPGFFLGEVVQLGDLHCRKKVEKIQDCPASEIDGFMIRQGSGDWQLRPGKPAKNVAITQIVIPIRPNEDWKKLTVGQESFLAYREYQHSFGKITGLAAILDAGKKDLAANLLKIANRDRLFAF